MKILWPFIALLVASVSLRSEVQFDGGPRFHFATIPEGRQILTNRDEFVKRLSSFDRMSRMKSERDVPEDNFLSFVALNVIPFTPEEAALVEQSLLRLKPKIEALHLPLPAIVQFLKTSGLEEGNAAYTRGTTIIIPASKAPIEADHSIDDLLCHELFHVLSRSNPALKERLYEAIGFQPCNEIEFPKGLERITNPDAPRNDHWIAVKRDGKETAVIPILIARVSRYDAGKGREFFDYLQFKLLVVQPGASRTVTYDLEKPMLLEMSDVEGFFQQVGRNTGYIIHPEEILADNFVLLVKGKKPVKSPEILEKIRAALRAPK